MNKKMFDWMYVGENLVVNCKTRELTREFLNLAHDFGYRWKNSDEYGGKYGYSLYNDYKDKTCHSLYKGEYADLDFYIRQGRKIVEFKGKGKVVFTLSDALILTLIAMWAIFGIKSLI